MSAAEGDHLLNEISRKFLEDSKKLQERNERNARILSELVKFHGGADEIPNLVRFAEEAATKLRIETPVVVSFSAKMKKTLGYYFPKRGELSVARIEISAFILRDEAELRDTVLHEFCHHKTQEKGRGQGHDGEWRYWMTFLGLPPNRCASESASAVGRRVLRTENS